MERSIRVFVMFLAAMSFSAFVLAEEAAPPAASPDDGAATADDSSRTTPSQDDSSKDDGNDATMAQQPVPILKDVPQVRQPSRGEMRERVRAYRESIRTNQPGVSSPADGN